MDISRSVEFARTSVAAWRARAVQAKSDIRRLDAASRPAAAGVIALGVVYGVLPLGALINVFRLIDAVTGARAVRVRTDDLARAFMTLAAIWVLAMAAHIVLARLHGLVAKIGNNAVAVARSASLTACMFVVAPWMTAVAVAMFGLAQPHNVDRRVRALASVVLIAAGVVAMQTLQRYLLSRDVTVGGFLLFAGSIVGTVSWMLLRVWRTNE